MLTKWKKLRRRADVYLSAEAVREFEHRLVLWKEIKGRRSEAAAAARRELAEWFALHLDWWDALWGDERRVLARLDLKAMGISRAASTAQQKKRVLAYFRERAFPEEPDVVLALLEKDGFDATEADLIRRHTFAFLNNPPFCLGERMDWNANPFGDIEWPTCLQRHYAWTELARAYRETGDEKYARCWVRMLVDWAARNPIRPWDDRHFAWSTLNAAIRCKTWARVFPDMIRSPAFTADVLLLFLSALRQNTNFLMTHRAPTGNWLLFESAGLLRTGCRFHEFLDAPAWRSEGRKRLAAEIAKQILPDGAHQELCPIYHCCVLDSFHYPLLTARLYGFGEPFDERYLQRLERAYRFLAFTAKPDGVLLPIGDTGTPKNVRLLIAHGARQFRNPQLLFVATGGKEGAPPAATAHIFRRSGHVVMRDAWKNTKRFLLFDVAAPGGWHSHRDSMQVIVWGFGADLLIDTGCYRYSEPEHSEYAETKYHNTITVNGQSQNLTAPKLLAWKIAEGFVYAAGVSAQFEATQHLREVVFVENTFWIVLDTILGDRRDSYQQWWHLGQRKATLDRGGACRTPNLLIVPAQGAGAACSLVPGQVVQYNRKRPRPVFMLEKRSRALTCFATLIYPHASGERPRAAFTEFKAPRKPQNPIELTVRTPEGRCTLVFSGVWRRGKRAVARV